MKKRIITLLAVVALLATCVVFAANAKVDTSGDWKCPCCDKAYSEITWITYGSATSYTFNTTNASGRHYLVSSDYNGNLGGGLEFKAVTGSDKIVVLFGKSSSTGTLVFGAAKGKRLLSVKSGVTAYLIGDGRSTLFSAGYSSSDANAGVFEVAAGGTLNMVDMKVTMKLGSGASGQITTLGGAKSGGLLVNAGTINMTNCQLDASPVVATGYGGAIYNEGTMTMTGGSVIGGKVTSQGGAIYNVGTMTLTNVTVSGGTAGGHGGTISMNDADAVMTIDGTSNITGGKTSNRGSAIYLGKGTLNIGGDAVINAAAAADAAEMYRGIYMLDGAGVCNLYGNATVKSSNQEKGDGVGLMYGTLTISGNASVVNESNDKAKCIYRWSGGTGAIQLDKDWTGTASVLWEGATPTNHGTFVGKGKLQWGDIDEDFVFTENTAAEGGEASGMYLEYADHANPKLFYFCSTADGCGVVTGRAQLFENGVATDWYLTPGTAISAYTKSSAAQKYIKLWANYDTNATATVHVDFNGRSGGKWTISTGKTLYAFDSTLAVGAEKSSAINTAGAGTLSPITQIGGKTYVVNNNKIYPVEMKINGVSLRQNAAEAGMYYTAAITAHENAGLTAWGVAVTLNDAETDLAKHLYTQETDAAKMGEFNSVLVKGIVKSEGVDDNADRAAETIYAKAYIQVGDTVAMSAAADYSLNKLVKAIADDGSYAAQLETMAGYGWYSALNLTV